MKYILLGKRSFALSRQCVITQQPPWLPGCSLGWTGWGLAGNRWISAGIGAKRHRGIRLQGGDRGVQIDELIGSFLGHKENRCGICSPCYFGKSTDPESEANPHRELWLVLLLFSWRVRLNVDNSKSSPQFQCISEENVLKIGNISGLVFEGFYLAQEELYLLYN